MLILGIDPGNVESAYTVWDGIKLNSDFGKVQNDDLMSKIIENPWKVDAVVIEQIKSYGMAVGETIFETVFWSGRFAQAARVPFFRVPRMEVKVNLCGSSRAKDGNVIQALIDRFAPDTPNKGKGTKKSPGFFYGFSKDVWQSFALSVSFIDIQNRRDETSCLKSC